MVLSLTLGEELTLGKRTFKWTRVSTIIVEIDGVKHTARMGVLIWKGYKIMANLVSGKKLDLHLPADLVPKNLRGLQTAAAPA